MASTVGTWGSVRVPGSSKTPTWSPSDPSATGSTPKSRVHVFYCVLALSIAYLMRREAYQTGLHLSVRELPSILGGIQETLLAPSPRRQRPPRAQRMLTNTDPIQRRLAELFGISATHPPAEHAT